MHFDIHGIEGMDIETNGLKGMEFAIDEVDDTEL